MTFGTKLLATSIGVALRVFLSLSLFLVFLLGNFPTLSGPSARVLFCAVRAFSENFIGFSKAFLGFRSFQSGFITNFDILWLRSEKSPRKRSRLRRLLK